MERTGDPTVGRPAFARPGTMIVWGSCIHFLLAAAPAVMLLSDGARRPAPLLAWAIVGVLTAGPSSIALGAAAAARERALLGQTLAGRALWGGYAAGGLLIAHFVWMLAWSPVALWTATGLSGSRVDDQLGSALVGLVMWVVVLAGVGLLAWTRWVMRRRVLRPVEPLLGERPQWVLGAVVFAVVTAPLSAFVVVVLSEGRAAMGTVLAGGCGLLAVGLLGGVGCAWSCALADGQRALRSNRLGPFVPLFVRSMGALLLVQFIVVFGMTLMTSWGSLLGARFVLQLLSGLIIVGAVAALAATNAPTPARRLG